MKKLQTMSVACFALLLSGCFEAEIGYDPENGVNVGKLVVPSLEGTPFCDPPAEEPEPTQSPFAETIQFSLGNGQMRIFDENDTDLTNQKMTFEQFGGTFKQAVINRDNFAAFKEQIMTTRYIPNPDFDPGAPIGPDNDVVMPVNHTANDYLPMTQFLGGSAFYDQIAGRIHVTTHFHFVTFFEGDPTLEADPESPIYSVLRPFQENRLSVSACQIQTEIIGTHTDINKWQLADLQQQSKIACTTDTSLDLALPNKVNYINFAGQWDDALSSDLEFPAGEVLDLNIADDNEFGEFGLVDGTVQLNIPLSALGTQSIPGIPVPVLQQVVPNGRLTIDATFIGADYPNKTKCVEFGDCPNIPEPEPEEPDSDS